MRDRLVATLILGAGLGAGLSAHQVLHGVDPEFRHALESHEHHQPVSRPITVGAFQISTSTDSSVRAEVIRLQSL